MLHAPLACACCWRTGTKHVRARRARQGATLAALVRVHVRQPRQLRGLKACPVGIRHLVQLLVHGQTSMQQVGGAAHARTRSACTGRFLAARPVSRLRLSGSLRLAPIGGGEHCCRDHEGLGLGGKAEPEPQSAQAFPASIVDSHCPYP
jgi:hypothetical protein